MSSSDFRQIAIRTDSGKAERLFRAVVSAFCCLPRPSRREIAQLEDLTLPLFDAVSAESLRFVAAALSECEHAPAALIRRLCEQPLDIAAPLLVRSRALNDIDLIALIGRHGLPHARAIARRKDLNPTIADLIHALEKPTLVRSRDSKEKIGTPAPTPETAPAANAGSFRRIPGEAAENARQRLRAIMLNERESEAIAVNPIRTSGTYAKLRETVLTGNAAFFQTALADALDVDFATARTLTRSADYALLLVALRALDLSEDKAFLIAVAAFPTLFPHPQAIRLFLDRYRVLHRDVAIDRVRQWKAETLSHAILNAKRTTANSDSPLPASDGKAALKAS